MSSGGFGDQFGSPGPADQPGPYGSAPQYGQPQYGQPQYGQAGPYGQSGRKTNSLAIASLCCGIGQFIAGPFAGIPAVILGFMSLGQIARSGEDGRGMAITGVVLGIVGLLLTALVIILFVTVWNTVSSNGG
jgi:Domain of unknown function (DUF4190)